MSMTELTGQKDRAGDLRELSDPEFFTHWAAVRNRLARTPEGDPGRNQVKRQYEAVITEYRRRIDGGLAVTDADD
jgi:hypothetical protein